MACVASSALPLTLLETKQSCVQILDLLSASMVDTDLYNNHNYWEEWFPFFLEPESWASPFSGSGNDQSQRSKLSHCGNKYVKGVGREGEVSLPDKSTFHLCVYRVCCVGSVLVRTRSCELSTDGKLRPLIVPRLEQILLFSNDDDFCSDHWNRTWSIFKCFLDK